MQVAWAKRQTQSPRNRRFPHAGSDPEAAGLVPAASFSRADFFNAAKLQSLNCLPADKRLPRAPAQRFSASRCRSDCSGNHFAARDHIFFIVFVIASAAS
jgi:hypothetical protein